MALDHAPIYKSGIAIFYLQDDAQQEKASLYLFCHITLASAKIDVHYL